MDNITGMQKLVFSAASTVNISVSLDVNKLLTKTTTSIPTSKKKFENIKKGPEIPFQEEYLVDRNLRLDGYKILANDPHTTPCEI
eukprot:8868985-Ditylum_brightwellii.AAC.1